MNAYFFDSNMRYTGSRALKDGEICPENATTVSVSCGDGQEAYFNGTEWIVSDLPTPTPPTQDQIIIAQRANEVNELIDGNKYTLPTELSRRKSADQESSDAIIELYSELAEAFPDKFGG